MTVAPLHPFWFEPVFFIRSVGHASDPNPSDERLLAPCGNVERVGAAELA